MISVLVVRGQLPLNTSTTLPHPNVFSRSNVACIALSHCLKGPSFPWRRIRGMFVTVDSAHAREWLSLSSISAITLCWRNAAAVMKETLSIAGHLEFNILDSSAANERRLVSSCNPSKLH